MAQEKAKIGIVGLGVMGRNLLLNMSDHGFSVAGYDKDLSKVESLKAEGKNKKIHSTHEIRSFIENLSVPRSVLLLVPAGHIVDR